MLERTRKQALINVFLKGTRLSYKKAEFIIRPQETPSGVFYIESGLVKAYDITKYGEENLLIIRKGDEIFPLIWAVTGQERAIIYQAMDDTVLWRIPREKLTNHLKRNPESYEPLLDITTEMYRLHSEHILNLEYRTIRERVMFFLLHMAERFGVTNEDGSILLDVPLKQQDIASSINATRESTSRELVRLERLGLVDHHRGKIIITKPDVLQSSL